MQQWTKQDYKENLSTGVWVVKYGAEWCKPCHKMESLLDSICSQFPNLEFVAVDGDEIPQLVAEQGVMEYPTVCLFVNGKERGRVEGLVSEKTVKDLLTAWNALAKAQHG